MIRNLLRLLHRKPPAPNHPFHGVTPVGLDYRGIPTAECLCGGRTFYMVGWFDDGYEVAGYLTDGLCCSCSALVTLCTEIDNPAFEEH